MRRLWPLLLLAGCGYPASQVTTGAAQPTLRVLGARPSANLLVDGVSAGAANFYGEDGHVLRLAHGTHRVVVADGATTLFDSDIYFGEDTTRTITLAPAAP